MAASSARPTCAKHKHTGAKPPVAVAPAAAEQSGTKILNDDFDACRATVFSIKNMKACRAPLGSDSWEIALGWRNKASACGHAMARFADGWWISDIPFASLNKKVV
jgi:hypothetical protein